MIFSRLCLIGDEPGARIVFPGSQRWSHAIFFTQGTGASDRLVVEGAELASVPEGRFEMVLQIAEPTDPDVALVTSLELFSAPAPQ